ncbi:hypothetical protein [Dyella sp.]|uniref:hypothetical protein n=1 Tax=Dyella sp. TaxID=1869338 RepID=UPI00284516D5|nr:hypothetical protein [Dyella sp.]MDR3445989.1 hypothetical protein [Dyella sp.]
MSAIENFSTTQLQNVIPSYLYQEYADDDDLQAFVDAQNALAQGYQNWFLQTPLGLYTAPSINGPLLDWVGQGVYGISRPVLSTQTSRRVAGYNEYTYNTFPYDGLKSSVTGTAQIASDDIYKRVLTWHLYKGDGYQFSVLWLKKRIARFLNGVNGTDYPVLDVLPSITVSGSVFTVNEAYSQSLVFLQQCISNNVLALPFQYSIVINAVTLSSDGGVLVVNPFAGYPSNSTSLPPGNIYSNGGAVCVVPGITPNPSAPPVYFGSITADELYSLGGGNLPLTNPGVGTGQLWNNGGVVCIA